MSDESVILSLEPVIEALKASISMQKAVANHLDTLEKLRAYGYSNGFISAAISKGSKKTISSGLFASMMYRARMKTLGMEKPWRTQVSTSVSLPRTESALVTTTKPIIPILNKNNAVGKINSEKEPHPWAHLANGTGDRRRNTFIYDPTPNLEAIYQDSHQAGGAND